MAAAAGPAAARDPGANLMLVLVSTIAVGPLLTHSLSAMSPLVIADMGITESRFGLLTGVVAWSWLRGGSAGRKPAAKPGSGSVAPPKSTRRQRAEGSLGDALQGLVSACQHGQPGGLAGPAEKLVRDAHALWYGTARAEADRWAEGA